MNEQNYAMRRRVLRSLAVGGMAAVGGAWSHVARAADVVTLPFENGLRPLTNAFPQKGEMLLLRSRPPLLETPFDGRTPIAAVEDRVEGLQRLRGGATMFGILAGADELPQVALGNPNRIARQALAAPSITIPVPLDRLTGFEFNRRVQAFDRIGGRPTRTQNGHKSP